MKSKRKTWLIAVITLLLTCGIAFTQIAPSSQRGARLRGGMRFPQIDGAAATRSGAETLPETPALSLTWGIYTYPGSVGSYVAGVNKAGHIVGAYGPSLDLPLNNGPAHGFLLKKHKFTSFDYPGAAETYPYGINDAGEIVGGWIDSSGYQHSFLLASGKFTTIDPPGSNASDALGINKAGDIVGIWSADDFYTTCHGYLYSKGTFTTLDYPGANCTFAWGINNAGEIAGYYSLSLGSGTTGFVYSKGTFTTLNYPGGYFYNGVFDINDNGLVLGAYGNNGEASIFQHCYLYQSGQFTSCDAPFGPPALTYPTHLNDYGVIGNEYFDNSGTAYGAVVTVGP